MEESYSWFPENLTAQNTLKDYLVMPDDFEGTIEFMQFACIRLNFKDSLTRSLLICLREKKDKLCHSMESIRQESQASL